MKKTYFILLLIAMTTIISSCSDDEGGGKQKPIPDMEVHLYVNTSLAPLKNTYGIVSYPSSEYEKVGYGGVLVINGEPAGSVVLYAYDLACPVEANENIRVVELKDELGKVKCEHCGMVFSIADGEGKSDSNSKYSLKKYQTQKNLITNPNY